MPDIAIRVENLSKLYRIGAQQRHDTLRDTIAEFRTKMTDPRRRRRNLPSSILDLPSETEFWALKDVSFEVKPGEVVGIIGRNGAGKSTLLKILSRITEPTEGRAAIHGRVGSLLEVGTGFHPELTGRENIFLNGAILGMRRHEIAAKFDEIVAFSEIEKFLDTPVKRYSSGMYVRLAFAVAAHLEPEILLVDEVLAVGDAGFQKRCLGKMGEVARQGRTVLFISHNMIAIQSLCGTSMWLDAGRVISVGATEQIVSDYLAHFGTLVAGQEWPDVQSAPGNDIIRLRSARATPEDNTSISQLTVATPLRLEFEYWNLGPTAEHSVSIHISDFQGVSVFSSRSDIYTCYPGLAKGTCHIPANLLNDGTYHVMLAITQDWSSWLYSHDDLIVFQVHDVGRIGGWLGKWPGVVRPVLNWSILQAPNQHTALQARK